MTDTMRAVRQRLAWGRKVGVGKLDILIVDRSGMPRKAGPVIRNSVQLNAHIRMAGRK